jgi:hypothetical protein
MALHGSRPFHRTTGKDPSEDTLEQRNRRGAENLKSTLFDSACSAPVAEPMVAALLERPAIRELRLHECWHDVIIDRESLLSLLPRHCRATDQSVLRGRGRQGQCRWIVVCRVARCQRSDAVEGVNPGSGAGGLVELMAAHRPRPKVARVHKTGLTAATNYVFAYAGVADGSAFADMHAQAGYSGSLDHVYTIEPASVRADAADADRGFLRHANRPCPCDQCLQGATLRAP